MAKRLPLKRKASQSAATAAAGFEQEIAALRRQLDEAREHVAEALEQQTATSDVLKVLSRSAFDLQTVFNTLVESAVTLCHADRGTIRVLRDGAYHHVATYGFSPEHIKFMRAKPAPADGTSLAGRVARSGRPVHIVDVTVDPELTFPRSSPNMADVRTLLGIPLLRDGKTIGLIVLTRSKVQPFTERQIELVSTFADQAVIAIENARLLTEQREALERQTATSEVLQVINSSPGDLAPVFNAMLEKAMTLCGAAFGFLNSYDGQRFVPVAMRGVPPQLTEYFGRGMDQPQPGEAHFRILNGEDVIHNIDQKDEEAYRAGLPLRRAVVDLGGARTALVLALRKENTVLGALTIYRKEVRPFSDKEIDLMRSFAAQAVIAIENTRLLNELRQRTDDLSEALEQETATSDVLKVISSSPGELEPVFSAMLKNATRICEADFGVLFRYDNAGFHFAASIGVPPKYAEFMQRRGSFQPEAGVPLHQLLQTKDVVYRADDLVEANPGPAAEYGGARSLLAVPMLKDSSLVGAFVIYRTEIRPFLDRQIKLVKLFASQAVIAIENARLLNELRERTDELSEALEQQTAVSEVLSVISSSPGELRPVFDAILQNATRICEAQFGNLFLREGNNVRTVAVIGVPSFADSWRQNPVMELVPNTPSHRVLGTGQIVQILDMREDDGYLAGNPRTRQLVEIGGARTFISFPMMKEDQAIGTIGMYRQEVRPFSDKQIELMRNFAKQAVIAIENVRLFDSVQARTRELMQSLQDLQVAQDRLIQTEKLASLGQLTAGIAHEIKNPLNFVNNFSAISVELIDELRDALNDAHLDGKLRGEINELAEMLQGNLEKVVQHGKRADSIVKNMLSHSRQGSGEHRPVDINAILEESLNLAYHGARAEKQDFNINLERSFDPAAGEVDVFPQEITRVLLNLISNGFYAATKRKKTSGGDYEPILAAATQNLGDRVEIRIRDNGTGIPPEIKEKIFNPFFTTKPAGEGTGLGLSLSHDIIVKQHAGTIEVDTRPGDYTEFKIILPRGAAAIAKSGGQP